MGSEFGRTPYAEKNGTGRDHNPNGCTVRLAGAGIKPGRSFGSRDDLGHLAVDGKAHVHHLHATILHLLGLNHERLIYRPNTSPRVRPKGIEFFEYFYTATIVSAARIGQSRRVVRAVVLERRIDSWGRAWIGPTECRGRDSSIRNHGIDSIREILF